MAHFAELDENNVVTRVIVVNDKDCCDFNGIESEEIGIGFCKKLFGSNTRWKQTSYNNKIRFRYAGVGYIYDENLDAFIPPKPPHIGSWILNEEIADWESPLGPAPELTQEQIDLEMIYVWIDLVYQEDNTKGWVLISRNQETPPE